MLSRWYDPILVVGTERTLPCKVASLLDDLGVDVHPIPVHIDACMTRWEDEEVRSALMRLLQEKMSLRTFNLRLAILNEQRRRTQGPWAIAASYVADIPLPVLSHYLNPLVIWCRCDPAEAADLLLSVQPPTEGWTVTDALTLCSRRHQTLTRWLEGYRMLPIHGHTILGGEGGVVDEIVEFCGLEPTTEQLYNAMVAWTPYEGAHRGEEKEYATVDEG